MSGYKGDTADFEDGYLQGAVEAIVSIVELIGKKDWPKIKEMVDGYIPKTKNEGSGVNYATRIKCTVSPPSS